MRNHCTMVKPLEKSIKFWNGHRLLTLVELHVLKGGASCGEHLNSVLTLSPENARQFVSPLWLPMSHDQFSDAAAPRGFTKLPPKVPHYSTRVGWSVVFGRTQGRQRLVGRSG